MTDPEERDDAMHVSGSRETEALDRLLALRPEDLDGWEAEAAASIPAADRAAEEALDSALAGLIDGWKAAPELDVPEPSITAADFVGLPHAEDLAEGAGVPPSRRLRGGGLAAPSWLLPAAMAACLALVAFGTWQIRDFGAEPELPVDGPGAFKAVTADVATRVELSFSVERQLPTGVVVEPGRREAVYGPADRLALQVAVEGQGGWLYLFEAGDSVQTVWQRPVTAGLHPLLSDVGEPLVWQPDALSGRTVYLALVSADELDAGLAVTIARGVLAAPDRPDLWARPVLSADSFAVDWQDTNPDR